jgi:hypothetical protein
MRPPVAVLGEAQGVLWIKQRAAQGVARVRKEVEQPTLVTALERQQRDGEVGDGAA